MGERVSGYSEETSSVQVPNLVGKTETSTGENFAMGKVGEIAASHTHYTDPELRGYATVQNSARFGAELTLEALKRSGNIQGEIDQTKLVEAMFEVVEEAGIPRFDPSEGGGHAA